MDFLEVGKIINTHGLRGEVKIATWTDSPEDFEELENSYNVPYPPDDSTPF